VTGAIVGIDTSTPATATAVLLADGRAVEAREDPAPGTRPGHTGRLLALLEQALAEAGVGWDGVERLAVGVGPGGFTGLRIGIATARALAQARGLALVGVSSLRALAAGAEAAPTGGVSLLRAPGADVGAKAPGTVLAAIDARRGEAFAAAWADGRELLAPVALGPAALAERVAALPRPVLAVGDGSVRFRDELERAGAEVPADGSAAHRVLAVQVCRLGAEGRPAERDLLVPDYRREPDARAPERPRRTP
jgi:tRNA threonylcarbamoyladenosine biosynthesis protein TsaB